MSLITREQALSHVPRQFVRAFDDSIHKPVPSLDGYYELSDVLQFVTVMTRLARQREVVDTSISASNFAND